MKIIDREFCELEPENLKTTSKFLVEWTEIMNGAGPSLSYPEFYYCVNLRFFFLKFYITFPSFKNLSCGECTETLEGACKVKRIARSSAFQG
ncbi:conserved hypothetical protein [Ricinus communis]|uniref:Uncharacterized protein n=1 Tax=Ricinus communis TaxID=3988 RepID=B9SGE0_RICCO|nr:conserved hypothetical protein [Ricinus communis]